MTDSGSRKGAANLTPILMILSFAAMAGLLWWLNATAVGTEPVVMEEEPEADSVEAAATLVTREQLGAQASTMIGQTVRLEAVTVASRVGSNAFMVELGTPERSNPFLVVMDSALIAESRQIPQQTATVAGTIRERTDSILDAWIEAGTIPEAQRLVVEFSNHFLEATRVRDPNRASGEGQGGGEGGGDDGGGGDGGGTP